jgi:hypothetical protein
MTVVAAAGAASRSDTLRVGPSPCRIIASGSTLWVAVNGSGTVVRVNALRGRISRRYRVGGGPGALAVAGRYLGVGNYVGRTVLRVADSAGSTLTRVLVH